MAALASIWYRRWYDGISARRAYGIHDPPAPGVDHQVSETGPEAGCGPPGQGSDPGDMPEREGRDHQGAYLEGPRAHVCVGAAAGDGEPIGTAVERQDLAPVVE